MDTTILNFIIGQHGSATTVIGIGLALVTYAVHLQCKERLIAIHIAQNEAIDLDSVLAKRIPSSS
ncbi:hypothetical protein Ddye_017314 [Dipteronia dyeriana]|uniref:Uncharacterized protein n=1 Tax=Dipteronia dyeriana TaxID=168575 RepID=A0AAD9U9G3_9ROSI|nr:hypothetical protein Ddye_017314 [Dipteronia dyeriana]